MGVRTRCRCMYARADDYVRMVKVVARTSGKNGTVHLMLVVQKQGKIAAGGIMDEKIILFLFSTEQGTIRCAV